MVQRWGDVVAPDLHLLLKEWHTAVSVLSECCLLPETSFTGAGVNCCVQGMAGHHQMGEMPDAMVVHHAMVCLAERVALGVGCDKGLSHPV